MTTIQEITDDIGRRTALLARTSGKDEYAVQPRDVDSGMITGFIVNGTLRVAIAGGQIDPTPQDATPAAFDETEAAAVLETIPKELENAIVYFAISEWMKAIGDVDQGEKFHVMFEKECTQYRVNPRSPSRASRPYRPI